MVSQNNVTNCFWVFPTPIKQKSSYQHRFPRNCTPRPFRTYAAKDLILSRLVSNYVHFAWGTECVFCCHSASIKGFLLKIRTSQRPRVCCKTSKFGCYRSVIKGGMLGCIALCLFDYLGFQSREFHTLTHRTCARRGASLSVTGQQVRTLYLAALCLRLSFCFHWKYFPLYSRLILILEEQRSSDIRERKYWRYRPEGRKLAIVRGGNRKVFGMTKLPVKRPPFITHLT
jgi:hypothetical protein